MGKRRNSIVKRSKRKTKSTRKSKKASVFFRPVKRILSGIITVLAGCIALLFLFDCYFPVKDINTSSEKSELIHIDKVEIPKLITNRKEQIIDHEGFTLSYNSDLRIANWVAYELTAEEAVSKKVERSKKFLPDPKVKGPTAVDEDYRRSGYDRGHLVPAGDMKWSIEGMEASFYFSNICPQDRNFNSGIWNDLEQLCRKWAVKHKKIYIVTGPVIENNLNRLGKNKVAIPKVFYKVICSLSDNKLQSIGFLIENRNYQRRDFDLLAIPIDSVEKVTGIQFFPTFSKEHQVNFKSKVNLNYWGI